MITMQAKLIPASKTLDI